MKFSIRNLFMGLVIVIVLAFVLLRGDQLVELANTMKEGTPVPLVAAIITQLGKYFAQSFAYVFAFKAVDEHMSPRNTLPLVFGTFFMNTVAPSANLAGITLVVDDARRRGIAPGKATSAGMLMQITIDSGFCIIMLVGFAILALTEGLSPVWFLLGLLVMALVSVLVVIMVVGHKNPQLLLRVLRPIGRLANKILAKFKKGPIDEFLTKTVLSFGEAGGLIAHNPRSTAAAFGCSAIASLCELACFCLVGIGFGVHNPQALVCGYVVATLFAMISFTPQGVGIVEAAVIVAFTTFGETAAAGTAIALVYRGIVFWMPFLIGAVLIQCTKSFKMEAARTVRAGDAPDALQGTARVAKRLGEAQSAPPVSVTRSDARGGSRGGSRGSSRVGELVERGASRSGSRGSKSVGGGAPQGGSRGGLRGDARRNDDARGSLRSGEMRSGARVEARRSGSRGGECENTLRGNAKR